jgi:hypothetical protein
MSPLFSDLQQNESEDDSPLVLKDSDALNSNPVAPQNGVNNGEQHNDDNNRPATLPSKCF